MVKMPLLKNYLDGPEAEIINKFHIGNHLKKVLYIEISLICDIIIPVD
jgi:hypothetical protein